MLELVIAVLGSATVGAVVTHFLGRRKTAAEIGLIGAQSDKTAAEGEKIRAETYELYAKLERRAETIEGEIVEVIDLANASLILGAAQSEGKPSQLIEEEISERLRSIAGASERSVRSDNLDLLILA